MSGTDSVTDPVTGIPGDVVIALKQNTQYPLSVLDAMYDVKHGPCTVFLAGDSLGGMVAQVVAKSLVAQGKTTVNVLTFNSPMMNTPSPGVQTVMFAEHGDAVISLTPLGIQQNAIGHPEITWCSDVIYPNPYKAHTAIYTDKHLQSWDVLGNPIVSPNYQQFDLGPVSIFPANPNTP
jgi:hypothetical protein